MTNELLAKLTRLQNGPTRYEVVMSFAGTDMLVAYTPRKSNAGLVSAVQKQGATIVKIAGLPDDVRMTVSKGIMSIGSAVTVKFSGRTQRDAYCNGELPFVGA